MKRKLADAALWSVVGMALLIGAVLIVLPYYRAMYEFLRPIGEAVLISGFLAGTVDRYVKARLLRETSKDIAKYLIGYRLPNEIQDAIHELMATSIVRENCEARYNIHTPVKGRVTVDVEMSYDLVNYSSNPQLFPHKTALEKHDSPKFKELSCHSDDPEASYCMEGDALRVSEDEPAVMFCYGKEFNVQPKKRGLTYRACAKYSLTLPQDGGDIVSFFGPAIGITVVATHPQELEFVAPKAAISSKDRWEYRGVFLPGQHVHVHWYPKHVEAQ